MIIADIAAFAAVIGIFFDIDAVATAPIQVIGADFFGDQALAKGANLRRITDVAFCAAVVIVGGRIDANIVNACIGAA